MAIRGQLMSLAVCLGLCACGGDGHDEDAYQHISGVKEAKVAGDAVFADVSPEDSHALCQEYWSWTSAMVRDPVLRESTCTADGIVAGADGEDCEAARDRCRAHKVEDDPDANLTGSDTCRTPACKDVTVGEWRACLDGIAQAAKERAKLLSCDLDAVPAAKPAPACKLVQERCPDLLGDGGED